MAMDRFAVHLTLKVMMSMTKSDRNDFAGRGWRVDQVKGCSAFQKPS